MTSLSVTPGIRIEDVVVGERARKDMGDIPALMASIQELTLLQPIAVTPDNQLVFGARRLEACRRLGWKAIPFVVLRNMDDALAMHKAERDENTCRKNMTPSELMVMTRTIDKLMAERGREAMAAGGGDKRSDAARDRVMPTGTTRSESPEPHRTNDKVAAAVGMSPREYARIKRVHTAANDEDEHPEVRKVAQQAMQSLDDGSISANQADNRMRVARINATEPTVDKPVLRVVPETPGDARNTGRKSINRSAAKQRDVMERACLALEGLADALKVIDRLQPEITATEAAQWKARLMKTTGAIRHVVNTALRERIESETA